MNAGRLNVTFGSVSIRTPQISTGSAMNLLVRAGEAVFIHAPTTIKLAGLAETDLVMIGGPGELEREFQKRGTTIRRELRRIRVERAIDVLRDPDYTVLSIQQIARHVGYSGASSRG